MYVASGCSEEITGVLHWSHVNIHTQVYVHLVSLPVYNKLAAGRMYGLMDRGMSIAYKYMPESV